MAKLTAKQQRFAEEYLVDLNATQAAIRAGYSEKTARSVGAENLKKPEIQEAIQKAMKERSERCQITADAVLQQLAKIGFADIKSVINWDAEGNITFVDCESVDGTIISEVSLTEIDFGSYVKRIKKIKLYDKLRPLEMLGKHLGMFKDNISTDVDIKVTIVDDIE